MGTGTRGQGRGDACLGTWDAGTREDVRSGTRESENRKADTACGKLGDVSAVWL